jgi:hypothetical protein
MTHSLETSFPDGHRTGAGSLEKPEYEPSETLGTLTPSPSASVADKESTWPTGWRPYGALFVCRETTLGQRAFHADLAHQGGFLLMFNSWGM